MQQLIMKTPLQIDFTYSVFLKQKNREFTLQENSQPAFPFFSMVYFRHVSHAHPCEF